MHLANYLGYLHRAELNLAEGFRKVADGHAEEADVFHTCNTLAKQCQAHAEMLQPFVDRYGEEKPEEPERLSTSSSTRPGRAASACCAIYMICT
jgi:hypothetical protein